MASFISIATPWHSGEERFHRLMNVPLQENPTSACLTPQAAYALQEFPLLAIGTLDSQNRPWTTIWGGENGFSAPLGGGMVGVRTAVDMKYDPVIKELLGGKEATGEVVKAEGKGRVMAGLAIDLMSRKRVKFAGRFVAGAVRPQEDDEDRPGSVGEGEIQAVVRVEESLGNCPKYLNKKEIKPAALDPKPQPESAHLSPEAVALLAKADLFFVSSSNAGETMDTNHRGGSVGFVRVISNREDGAEIIWPEYSGNRLYQTLGNLTTTPAAGLVFPDFETGDVLYLTGTTEILVGRDAAVVLPRSNLAVKVKITEARFVAQGLPFRGTRPGDSSHGMSPYNPSVRLLASEGALGAKVHEHANVARLVEKTEIAPTINRYKFELLKGKEIITPGQWVALDFSEELDIGYTHMRDDDPTSLNDDFVRTFTVSNPPVGAAEREEREQAEFEVTLRRHGPVTAFLGNQSGRTGLEVAVKGFGGEFRIEMPLKEGGVVPFIAGGVGITPLLGQLPLLDLSKLRLLWILRLGDADFVLDTFGRNAGLAASTTVFFTRGERADETLTRHQEFKVEDMKRAGAKVLLRRPEERDFQKGSEVLADVDKVEKWYLCAGQPLRRYLLEWLRGRTVVFENFDY